jgi:hypothetical protein
VKKTLAALASLTALIALNACSTTPQAEAPAPSAAPSQSTLAASSSTAPMETSAEETAITITAGDQTFNATINDSQVSRDFLAALPTTLSWERNAGIEYITELSAPITPDLAAFADLPDTTEMRIDRA